jgi:hypothetical protein
MHLPRYANGMLNKNVPGQDDGPQLGIAWRKPRLPCAGEHSLQVIGEEPPLLADVWVATISA